MTTINELLEKEGHNEVCEECDHFRAKLEAAEKELQNVVSQADYNPFLAVGILLEHHSKIKEVLMVIAASEGKESP